jgi:UDP:flavonoid glycosyltransferase YjiC (YdhE family)
VTSVLLTALPAQGHVGPVLVVARHLAARGHRVRVLTGARFADQVAATGADLVALPDDAVVLPETLGVPIPGGPRGVRFALEHLFVAPVAAQFRAVQQALAAKITDVVVTELLFMGSYPLVGLRERPRLLLLGISPLPVRGGGTAPYGLGLPPATGAVARVRNSVLEAALDRFLFGPPQDLMRREFARLTGRTLTSSLFDLPLETDAVLQLCPPGFEYPRPGLPVHVRFAGPLPLAPRNLPDPVWWPELGDGRSVVHVTQGTEANKDFSRLLVPAIRALADRPVLVVASTGGRPAAELAAELGEVPANARLETFLDYSRFLPRIDALVTNGRYGTVNLALAQGVPIVTSGRTEDKAEVGARVTWSGVGIDLRSGRPAPRAISDAVGRVLGEPGFRQAAERLQAEIEVAGGLAAIEELVRG